jgi:hypothetical protein
MLLNVMNVLLVGLEIRVRKDFGYRRDFLLYLHFAWRVKRGGNAANRLVPPS